MKKNIINAAANQVSVDYVIETFRFNNVTKKTTLFCSGNKDNEHYAHEYVVNSLIRIKRHFDAIGEECGNITYSEKNTVVELSFRDGDVFTHLTAFPKGMDRVDKREFFETKLVIRDLEGQYQYDEEELRNAVRRVLPSWKITKESEYGLHRGNGYQECRFQIYKKDARIDIHFYDYVD